MATMARFWADMRSKLLTLDADDARMLAVMVQRIPPDRLSREETILAAKLVRRAREMST